MNPLAVAVQGLGFSCAAIALQGLLQFVAQEVQKYEHQVGSGLKTRRRITTQPIWLPAIKTDDDEALLMIIGAI